MLFSIPYIVVMLLTVAKYRCYKCYDAFHLCGGDLLPVNRGLGMVGQAPTPLRFREGIF